MMAAVFFLSFFLLLVLLLLLLASGALRALGRCSGGGQHAPRFEKRERELLLLFLFLSAIENDGEKKSDVNTTTEGREEKKKTLS